MESLVTQIRVRHQLHQHHQDFQQLSISAQTLREVSRGCRIPESAFSAWLPSSVSEHCAQTYHELHQSPFPNKQETFQEGFPVVTGAANGVRLMDCTELLTAATECVRKENALVQRHPRGFGGALLQCGEPGMVGRSMS